MEPEWVKALTRVFMVQTGFYSTQKENAVL
jgi:hypothetical protein